MWTRATLAFVVCVSACGCGSKEKKIEAIVERNRAETRAKITAISEVAKRPLPPLSADRITYGGPPLKEDENMLVLSVDAAQKPTWSISRGST